MVNRLASQKEKEELMTAFRALDINKDGKLSKDELKSAFSNNQEFFGFSGVEQLMDTLDTNGSGFIDYSGKHSFRENSSQLQSTGHLF